MVPQDLVILVILEYRAILVVPEVPRSLEHLRHLGVQVARVVLGGLWGHLQVLEAPEVPLILEDRVAPEGRATRALPMAPSTGRSRS